MGATVIKTKGKGTGVFTGATPQEVNKKAMISAKRGNDFFDMD